MEFWKTLEPLVINIASTAIVVAIVLAWLRRNRARECWQAWAKKHAFRYLPAGLPRFFSRSAALAFQNPGEVTGEIENLPFRMYVDIRGTGKNRRFFTILSVEIPEVPAGLTIYRENAFLKLTKLFGARDVTTGDPNFDARFLVKGNDPSEVTAWLNATRRVTLLRMLGEDPDTDICEGCLRFQRRSIVDSEEVLEKAFVKLKTTIPYLKPRQ
jgi:hypothetical protein